MWSSTTINSCSLIKDSTGNYGCPEGQTVGISHLMIEMSNISNISKLPDPNITTINVQKPWIEMIKNNKKRIESRTGNLEKYIRLVNNWVMFNNLRCLVTSIRHYNTFMEYLDSEGWINAVPIANSKNEAIEMYMNIIDDGTIVYSDENVAIKGGVVAIMFEI